MATLRWGRSSLDTTAKLRWGRSSLDGTVTAVPKLRWGRSELSGTAAVVVNSLTNLVDIEPETLITITATLQGGGSADTWTWRRISGPTVVISGTNGQAIFRAPSAMPPGATLVLGVTAIKSGVTSNERTISITTLPQTRWWYDNGTWRGRQPTVWL